jgi:type I site-specific restriction endonuclease
MERLNFSPFKVPLKIKENKRLIWDPIRKKYLQFTPEEWVRQHCVQFLLQEVNVPQSLVNVEKKLNLNGRLKRYDIVVFSSQGKVQLLVECKAPSVGLSQKTLDQLAQYNSVVDSTFLMLTNGLQHIYCQINTAANGYTFLKSLPPYQNWSA